MVYPPPAFTETREGALIAHIERYDFAVLVTRGAEAPIVSQIPFLLERRDGRLFLQAISRARTPRSQTSTARPRRSPCLPARTLISRRAGGEMGPAVPTWNYASVHAYGPAQRIDHPEWLRGLVRRLSERHEAREPAPWRMEDLPEPYVQAMLKGIVGLSSPSLGCKANSSSARTAQPAIGRESSRGLPPAATRIRQRQRH